MGKLGVDNIARALANKALQQSGIPEAPIDGNSYVRNNETWIEEFVQSAVDVKTAYESNADTNAYTDAEKTKLAGIEDGAEVNQTDAEIKTQYENNPDTNAYTDNEKTKLAGIEEGAEVNPAWVEINSDTDLAGSTNFSVDTTAGIVYINVPDGITKPFMVWDRAKNFNSNSCIINIKDNLGAIIHTAELDIKDTAYIFYYDGTYWKYGVIGGGEILSISSAHIASVDFGNLVEQSDDRQTLLVNGGVLTDGTVIDDPDALVPRGYLDTALDTKMTTASYDPLEIGGNVFSMEFMLETLTKKIFTDAERIKLAGLESSKYLGTFVDLTALETAYPSPPAGSYAYVDAGVGHEVQEWIWDDSDDSYHQQASTSSAETPASIKAKYESNLDTNAFTDNEKTKLAGIEDGAEVNVQSDWDEVDTNSDAYIKNKPDDVTDLSQHSVTELNDVSDAGSGEIITTTERNKLNGIEEGAEVNQTDAEIKIQYENNPDTNAYTDAEKTKLSGIEDGAEVNVQSDWTEADTGSDAYIKNKPAIGTGDMEKSVYDPNLVEDDAFDMENMVEGVNNKIFSGAERTKLQGIEDGAEVNQTDAEIKIQYENNPDTNAFTDGAVLKLAGIEAGAEVNVQSDWNQTDNLEDDYIKNKPDDLTDLSQHSVEELSDVSDAGSGEIITTTERNNITTNNAKVTNATHTGEVTGNEALTVQPEAISNKASKTPLAGTEEVLINDGGVLKKTTSQNIADLGGASGFTLHFDANDAIYNINHRATANSRNGHPIIEFSDADDDGVTFGDTIPNSYDAETITVDIDWVAATATSGAVSWFVSFERNAPGGNDIDSDSYAAAKSGTTTTNATNGVVTRTSITFTKAEADSVEANDHFRLKLIRDPLDGGDTMTGDAQLLKVSVRV